MTPRYLNHVFRPDEIHTIVAALRVAAEVWDRDAQTAAEANQDRVSEQFQSQVHSAEALLESFEACGF